MKLSTKIKKLNNRHKLSRSPTSFQNIDRGELFAIRVTQSVFPHLRMFTVSFEQAKTTKLDPFCQSHLLGSMTDEKFIELEAEALSSS